jgi:hypothetical protein
MYTEAMPVYVFDRNGDLAFSTGDLGKAVSMVQNATDDHGNRIYACHSLKISHIEDAKTLKELLAREKEDLEAEQAANEASQRIQGRDGYGR